MPGVFGNQISAVDVNMENSTTVTDDFDYVKFAMDHVFGPNFNPADNSNDVAVDNSHAEELKKPFEILKNVYKLKAGDDIAPYLIAFEAIYENVRKMHLYADCEELQIKELLSNCLRNRYVEIKKGACDTITQICNIEPDCKEFFTDSRLICKLLSIVHDNADNELVSKSLDALIAILSCNSEALSYMQCNAGLSILLNTLIIRDNAEWNIKIADYFREACETNRELPLKLISQEYIRELVRLIAKDRKESHCSLIKLLTVLIDEDCDALEELSKANVNLQAVLRELLTSSAGQVTLRNERQACLQLLSVIRNLEAERPLYDRG